MGYSNELGTGVHALEDPLYIIYAQIELHMIIGVRSNELDGWLHYSLLKFLDHMHANK